MAKNSKKEDDEEDDEEEEDGRGHVEKVMVESKDCVNKEWGR